MGPVSLAQKTSQLPALLKKPTVVLVARWKRKPSAPSIRLRTTVAPIAKAVAVVTGAKAEPALARIASVVIVARKTPVAVATTAIAVMVAKAESALAKIVNAVVAAKNSIR